MKKHSTLNIYSLKYYPKRMLFTININQYYKQIGVPAMQQSISVYNPKTKGTRDFVFIHSDNAKYVYRNLDTNLLLYVYRKSKHPKKGDIDHLPWPTDRKYDKPKNKQFFTPIDIIMYEL